MQIYNVKKVENLKDIEIEVVGSKSITNRALMISALANGKSRLKGVLFSDDSRYFLQCLKDLGFNVNIDEENKIVEVEGFGGKIPKEKASIYVGSAGTAGRFLTAMLSFANGEYKIDASEQMRKRPMLPLIKSLENLGVEFEFLEQEGCFPFIVKGGNLNKNVIDLDIGISSQFLSAILMSSVMLEDGIEVNILGNRKARSYVDMTVNIMKQFGVDVIHNGDNYVVKKASYKSLEYDIEPDLSGACYFYACAILLGIKVCVKNVHKNSMQGDLKFLDILEKMGCEVYDTEKGICVDGTKIKEFNGIEIDMSDFSDQTMTLSVIAPFAKTKTVIKNIGHIKFQETNRIEAILNELTKLGVKCEENEFNGITIYPSKIKPCEIETYNDHRMAMAFSLIGLKVDGIKILNPMCCKKTFENYFGILDNITK